MAHRPRTASVPLEHRQQTPAWVDARRDYIGSSDLPIITGSTPYGTSAFSLWAIKTRLAEPDPVDADTLELYELGHLLEDDIAERYTAQTGRPLRRANRMLVKRDLPWASANLDRISAARGERLIVEIKWVPWRDWRVIGPEPVPPYVQDQVQWQLMVTGWPAAEVAVLRGSKVERHEVAPDPEYQDNLRYLAEHFRAGVLAGTPPPIDGSESTRRTLTRLHPAPTLDLMEPTAETDALAADLKVAIAEAKIANEREDRLRNVFRGVLSEHAGVEGADYRVTWRKNADSVHVNHQAVAASYRWLLERIADGSLEKVAPEDLAAHAGPIAALQLGPELFDAIVALHSEVREGARVLLPKFRDEDTGKWK